MSDSGESRTSRTSDQNRARVLEAIGSLQKVLDDLDAIGPMIAGAYLSMAIETLRAAIDEELMPPKES